MNTFEIEIKSLLGSKANADALLERMKAGDPQLKSLGRHSQLNHYFESGDMGRLRENLVSHIPADKQAQFVELTEQAKEYSLRTRQADSRIIFVLKVSVDDTTASNGIARREFEADVDLGLDQLDEILLDSGFAYQAKWSRDREEYVYKGHTITIDKNAGYGYLAEFESVIPDASGAEAAKAELQGVMRELGVEELDQARLGRMFDYYNKCWPQYYGSDNVFTIE